MNEVLEPAKKEPNRAQKRERSRVRYQKLRLKQKDENGNQERDYWEWRPTQSPPWIRRSKRRNKNARAKTSRKANR